MYPQIILTNLELSLKILEYIKAHQDDDPKDLNQAIRDNRQLSASVAFGGSGGCRYGQIRDALHQDINTVFPALFVNKLIAHKASQDYSPGPSVEPSLDDVNYVCGICAHYRVYLTNLGEEFLKQHRQK